MPAERIGGMLGGLRICASGRKEGGIPEAPEGLGRYVLNPSERAPQPS